MVFHRYRTVHDGKQHVTCLLPPNLRLFPRWRTSLLKKYMYRINSFTKTPVNTVWYSATGAATLGLLAFAGPSATNALFSLSVVGNNIAYSIPIAARFIHSRDTFVPGPFYTGRWSFPNAVISVIFMAFINIIFFFPTAPGPTVANMNYSVIVLVGCIILSLAWYYFPVIGGVHWFRGPVRNVQEVTQNSTTQGSNSVDAMDDTKNFKKDRASDEVVEVQ